MQHVLNAVHLQLEVARRRMVFQARLEYGVWAQWDQPPLVEVIQAVFVERVFVGAVRTRADNAVWQPYSGGGPTPRNARLSTYVLLNLFQVKAASRYTRPCGMN